MHVVAPSGPVPVARLEQGVKHLRKLLRCDVTLASNLLDQEGYFAGSDTVRADALHRAFNDERATVLYCARGGYGATRLLRGLDPVRLSSHPKIIVGFSDATALLCWAWQQAGVFGLHGPVVTQLPVMASEDTQRLEQWLRGEVPPPLEASEGTVTHGGRIEGPLVAANLEVLRALVGTRFMPPLQGAILALEEVHEAPYRIDRSLTQLIESGSLRGVRAIVIGQLVNCTHPGGIGPSAHEVVLERCGRLGIPVVTGFAFGHDTNRNAPLPFGAQVRLHADDCLLEFLEPITQ